MAVEILEIQRFTREGWPICPGCGEDALLLIPPETPLTLADLADLTEAGWICEVCAWEKAPDRVPVPA